MPGTRKRFGFLKIIALVVVLLLIVIIALPFFLDANQFKPELESKLSSALGREVKLGQLRLSVLSGSIEIADILIADNPSFSQSPFVEAKSLQVSIELMPLIFSRTLRISGIGLEHPSIRLVESKSGRWNFSDLGGTETRTKSASPETSGNLSGKDISVKQLKIVDGQVTIIHSGENLKPSTYNNVNIAVSDLSNTTSFPFSLEVSLPGEGKLRLEGKAGPINSSDLLMTPLEAELRVEHFDLVSSGFVPGESALAGIFDFGGTVTSNGKEVLSKGQATANKVRVAQTGVPVDRRITLHYAVSYDMANSSGRLTDAEIEAGKAVAHLTGDFEIQGGNLSLKMHVHGAKMPVEDLTALLPAFGVTLPKGSSLQGGFMNADLHAEGPVQKMVTTGTVDIANTRLTGFDLSRNMAAVAALAGLGSNLNTEIERFSSGLQFKSEGIQVNNLMLVVPSLGELSGNGRIAADQALDFTMQAALKPSGALGAGLGSLLNGGALNIPFFVRGTASDPKFVPDKKRAAGALVNSVLGQGDKEGQTNSLGNTLRNLLKKNK